MTNMLAKIKQYIDACDLCQRTKPKSTIARPWYGRIPKDYSPMEHLSVDVKYMPQGFDNYKFLLMITCEQTNFVFAVPTKTRDAKTIAEALIHRVFTVTGPPRYLSVDKDSALTGEVIKMVLAGLECNMQIISPWNHGSSKAERQIQSIQNIITKQLTGKGDAWPLFASVSAYAMNTFASNALQGLTPFELVFARKPRDLTSIKLDPIESYPLPYRVYARLLHARAKHIRDLDMLWKTEQAQKLREENEMYNEVERLQRNNIVYALAPHASSLQSGTTKFRQDYIGPLAIDEVLDDTHYLLKDPYGYKLPGVYHINRLKKGYIPTPSGVIENYEQLRREIGTPLPALEASTPSEQSLITTQG